MQKDVTTISASIVKDSDSRLLKIDGSTIRTTEPPIKNANIDIINTMKNDLILVRFISDVERE